MPPPNLLSTCGLVGANSHQPALFFLYPRVNCRLYFPLQNSGVDLIEEAKECFPPITGGHPPIPFLEKRNHHPCLPIQRHLKFVRIASIFARSTSTPFSDTTCPKNFTDRTNISLEKISHYNPLAKQGYLTASSHVSVIQPRCTVSDHQVILQRRVKRDNPCKSIDLRYSGQILFLLRSPFFIHARIGKEKGDQESLITQSLRMFIICLNAL